MTSLNNMLPTKASFPVRRMDFEFDTVPDFWFGNDASLTNFMTSMSVMFPEGEGFFVDSIRAVRNDPRLKDLQKEISAFIGQEAMHSKEHHAFNHSARRFGSKIQALEDMTLKIINVKRFVKFLGPVQKIDLIATCALEHFTATIAAQLLRRQDMQDLAQDPVMLKMWQWHAIEENEHKAVAFDVYKRLYPNNGLDYAHRAIGMVVAMGILLVAQNAFMATLMKSDGKLAPQHWVKAIRVLYGRKGFLTEIMPDLFDYFRRDFHPNDHETGALLATWKEKVGFTG